MGRLWHVAGPAAMVALCAAVILSLMILAATGSGAQSAPAAHSATSAIMSMPASAVMEDEAPSRRLTGICKGGKNLIFYGEGSGIILPLVRIDNVGGQVILYLFTLLWMFLGVSIIADVFMGAIEQITSTQRQIVDKGDPASKHWEQVWNGTVANLTLMALGSSAPEILLSIIELVPNKFHSGDLGPSTIVGSAAFNLLCIIAVCVVALPDGDNRKIKELHVFSITCFFSIFAYIWLVFILSVSSPDIIEVWEAFFTLLFFPLLVYLSYLADIGKLQEMLKIRRERKLVWTEQSTMEEQAEMRQRIIATYGQKSEDMMRDLMKYEFAPPITRAAHRQAASRALVGGAKIEGPGDDFHETRINLQQEAIVEDTERPTFTFIATHWVVLEAAGAVATLTVVRTGPLDDTLSVAYATRDGTATAGDDYVAGEGVLEFGPGEERKTFDISVIDDNEIEPTEEFYVDLTKLEDGGDYDLGKVTCATIVVLDSDHPGTLAFEARDITVHESTQPIKVPIPIQRKEGATGAISVSYHTEDYTALAGKDYVEAVGSLAFDSGQATAFIDIEILPKGRYEATEMFRLVIENPTGGAQLDANGDGGSVKNIATITIEADEDAKNKLNNLRLYSRRGNMDVTELAHEVWIEQFRSAIFVNGSYEEQRLASKQDIAMHVLSLPWKVLFAFVPPTNYYGGWLCFFCSLGMIGVCTALISDLANLLGCAMSFKAELCAITFVALGTSLPDTFASKTAALQDSSADNSIGNVTGSNSVNVFLGLGLPWTMASIAWSLRDVDIDDVNDPTGWYERFGNHDVKNHALCTHGCFVVLAGDLGLNVVCFVICAMVCVAMLVARRYVLGYELGGDKKLAYATAAVMVALWLIYVGFNMRVGLYENW